MRHSVLALLCGTVLHAPLASAGLTGLGDMPGGTDYSAAWAISADGSLIVGESDSSSGLVPVVWNGNGNGDMVSLGVSGFARDISADGSVIAGIYSIGGHNEAFIWTASGGVVGLGVAGYTHSYTHAISADGDTVVGQLWGGGVSQSFLWTQGGGMQTLPYFVGGRTQSAALGVSDSGLVVGFASHLVSTEAYYWTEASGSLTGLGYLPGGNYSAAYAVTPDGHVISGESEAADGKWHPVLWRDSGSGYVISDLGLLGGWDGATAVSLTPDGSVVVGFALPSSSGDNIAFRWSSDHGMETVRDWLIGTGVDVGSWQLNEASDVSADGNTVVGFGVNAAGNTEAYVAQAGTLLGMNDFSASVGSLRDAALLPARISSGAIVADLPRLSGIDGYSASVLYRHVDGSSGDLGGAALTWRNERMSLSASGGAVAATTSALHDGGEASYNGWWLGVSAALAVPAVEGLELDLALRSDSYDSRIDRRYLNGAGVETAHGEPNVASNTVLVRLAWNRALDDVLTLTPHLQWLYNRTEVDAYTESGGGGAGHVNAQDNEGAQSSIGMTLSWKMRTDVELAATYSFNHLHDKNAAPVVVSVPLLGTFAVPGIEHDTDWHSAGVGLTWTPQPSMRVAGTLSATSGSDYPANWIAGMTLSHGF